MISVYCPDQFDHKDLIKIGQKTTPTTLFIFIINVLWSGYKGSKKNKMKFYQKGKEGYNKHLFYQTLYGIFICKYDEKREGSLVLCSDFLGDK